MNPKTLFHECKTIHFCALLCPQNVFSYHKDYFVFLLTIVKVYFICPIFVIVLVWSKCHFVVPRVRLSLLLAFLTGIFLLLVSDKKQKWKTKLNRIWKKQKLTTFLPSSTTSTYLSHTKSLLLPPTNSFPKCRNPLK